MRLDVKTIDQLGPEITRYAYDRSRQRVGIVHFGIGAFHRAHMAWYTDKAMDAGENDWSITGVSLRSPDVATQLNPQNGLYTVTERSAHGEATRVIGAIKNVLVATQDREAVIRALAAPAIQIASFTVTEKGYCRAADGSLDPNLAGADSFYAYVAQGLRRRHDTGLNGLTLLSCDNLAENGSQLGSLMHTYLALNDPGLVKWFHAQCTCPNTMVDRIVPATTPQDLAQFATKNGLEDEGAVVTEPFSQWVIEDNFAGARPTWERHGVQMVANVRPYETAKLRMLNGAHSLLAYCGLAHGHRFVHQALADSSLAVLVEQLMLNEAAPTIKTAPGQDLNRYARDLMIRFANPALNHRLIQIAMDGSQKIPQRWLETLEENQILGRSCPAILVGIDAWIRHLQGANEDEHGPVVDPMAETLRAILNKAEPEGAVSALFGPTGPMSGSWLTT
ncbi:MAG: mannitol dehydrogenase family protein [Sphingorhabdus sp.]